MTLRAFLNQLYDEIKELRAAVARSQALERALQPPPPPSKQSIEAQGGGEGGLKPSESEPRVCISCGDMLIIAERRGAS